jgi:TPR repeat protein
MACGAAPPAKGPPAPAEPAPIVAAGSVLAEEHFPSVEARRERAACLGRDPEACRRIGTRFVAGDGVATSDADAHAFLVAACALGSNDACAEAIELRRRLGKRPSIDVAVFALLSAPDEDAALYLGDCAADGETCGEVTRIFTEDRKNGVAGRRYGRLECLDVDLIRCYGLWLDHRDSLDRWFFTRACVQGGGPPEDCATAARGFSPYTEDERAQIPDFEKYVAAMPRACDGGIADACYWVANHLYYQLADEYPPARKDVKRYLELLQVACDRGHDDACRELATPLPDESEACEEYDTLECVLYKVRRDAAR